MVSEASRRAAEEIASRFCIVGSEQWTLLIDAIDTAIAQAVRAKDEEIVRLEKALDDALPPRYRRAPSAPEVTG